MCDSPVMIPSNRQTSDIFTEQFSFKNLQNKNAIQNGKGEGKIWNPYMRDQRKKTSLFEVNRLCKSPQKRGADD